MTKKKAHSPHATDWLKGKTADDFDIIEHEGRLFWPIKIHRLKGNKTWDEEPMLARVLNTWDIAKARREQMRVFREVLGFTGEDDHERHTDIYEELGIYAEVAEAVRVPKEPYGAWTTLEYLVDDKTIKVGRAEVYNIHAQLDVFGAFENARLEEVSVEQVVEIVLQIDQVRNLSPLVGIAGRAQDSWLLTTSALLASYLRGERSSPFKPTSTSGRKRAGSPESTSSESSAAPPGEAPSEPQTPTSSGS